ncbi:MAG: PAS domain S-box protein, partial [Candidatus Thorarchaeota archaeon]
MPARKASLKKGHNGGKSQQSDRFGLLVEASGALIVGLDRNGRITLFNRRCEKLTGYKREEVLGRSIFPLIIAEDERREVRKRFKQLAEGIMPSSSSKAHWVDKQGNRHLIQWDNTFITDEQGNVKEIFGIGIDLTEQESLQAIKQEYLLILETLSDVVLILDRDLRIVNVSTAVKQLIGYSPDELVGKTFAEIGTLRPDSLKRAVKNAHLVLQGKTTSLSIYELTSKKGELKFGEIQSAPLVRDGKVIGIISTVRDVTQRELAEAALRESEEKYRTLVEQSLEGLVIIQDNKIVFANTVISKLSGYSNDEIVNLSTEEMWGAIHPDDRKGIMQRLQDRMSGKPVPTRYEARVYRKDGSLYWADISVNMIEYEGKPAIQATYIDVTERKKAEEQYRSLFDSVPVGIFRTTPDGRILDANPALVEMLGYDNKEGLIQRKASEFYIDPKARKQWEILVQREEVVRAFEVQFQREDGTTLWIELNARAIRDETGQVSCYEGTLEDISERKHAEINLMTAHRRAEFLVDLMAHDLNNINQGILLTLEMLLNDNQFPDRFVENVSSALAQVERSAELISNVKRFQTLDSEPRKLRTRDLAPSFFAAVQAVE